MILLKQVYDFFRDLIFSATIPLLLGSLTGIIISIVLFVFISYAIIGFIDDYIRVLINMGIKNHKLVLNYKKNRKLI